MHMGLTGIFLFALGGAILFFALSFATTPNMVLPMGVVLGFVAFLALGAGLEEIISSNTKKS